MKKFFVILLMTLSSGRIANSVSTISNKNIYADKVITEIYSLKLKQKVVGVIIEIESKGDSMLVNKRENAVGLLQIRKILVDDVNNFLGCKRFTYNDRFNAHKSVEIFFIYQQMYNPSFNVERAVRTWNGGPNGCRNNKTLRYWHDFIVKF